MQQRSNFEEKMNAERDLWYWERVLMRKKLPDRCESEAMIEAKFQAIYGTLVFGPAHTSTQKEVTQEV